MQRELKVLLLASSLSMLAAGLLGPIYAIFVEEIGGGILDAGASYAIFSIAAGLLIFFVSRWEDHVKHQEKLVVLGYAFGVLGFLGYLMVRSPLDLFAVQVVFGVGAAVGTPAYDGLYSRHLDKGKFVSEWGLWESMAYIITGISAAIGSLAASLYGFKFLFTTMLLLSLVGLLVSFFLVFGKKNP